VFRPDSTESGTSHFLLAIRIDAFLPKEEFKQRLGRWLEEMKARANSKGATEFRHPGERTRQLRQMHRLNGVPLDPRTLASMFEIGRLLDVPMPKVGQLAPDRLRG
jgi:LDH2 family malate/lactate/ureidoglycolate dehydrogenase